MKKLEDIHNLQLFPQAGIKANNFAYDTYNSNISGGSQDGIWIWASNRPDVTVAV